MSGSGHVACRHAIALEAAAFDGLEVLDDVLDDEREALLRDHGIEPPSHALDPETLDLVRFAVWVTRGHARRRFQLSRGLRELEPLREQAH